MPSSFIRLGLAQINIRWEDPAANFQHIENLLKFDEGLDFLLLPEMWSTGFTMSPQTAAEHSPGPALNWMIENARRHNFVIGGSIAVEENGRFYNRWYAVHPDGKVGSYDKKHLFSYGKEDEHYTPGHSRPLIDILGWKILPIVCYDLRFPVWCRNTTGYDLMVVVANWPTPRIHHWDALLKARAIENQSYVAAVNRIGSDGYGLEYPGHSSIYDMNGSALMELKGQEGIGVYTLDKLALTKYRDHFRFLQDRDKFTM
ncbi:MAG: amidohydrolase [Saprospiraceae bacterium]